MECAEFEFMAIDGDYVVWGGVCFIVVYGGFLVRV